MMFQSSPTPKRGRYDRVSYMCASRQKFQSSPTPKRGRYGLRVLHIDGGISVSILAHAEARALRLRTGGQSRPKGVSILAHAEARALHQ